MEVTKRTYQKHKTEKKVTIKHYLNISNNHESFLNTQLFPVYVQVTYRQKTTKFKCKYSYFDEDEIPDYPKHNNLQDFQQYYCKPIDDDYSIGEDKYFSRDFQLIKWTVNNLIEINKDNFDISILPQLYHSKSNRLDFFVFWCLKLEIISIMLSEYGIAAVDTIARIQRIQSGSILEYLEYFIKKYPKIEILKEIYQSQIWYFGLYTDLGYEVEPKNSDEYFMFSFVNMNHMRELEKPSIVDYLSGTFQKRFIDCFEDIKVTSEIIKDIDKLFSKYYQLYLKKFFLLDTSEE